jgi:hypothetical protein
MGSICKHPHDSGALLDQRETSRANDVLLQLDVDVVFSDTIISELAVVEHVCPSNL